MESTACLHIPLLAASLNDRFMAMDDQGLNKKKQANAPSNGEGFAC
jgi:hypothetical protein